MARHATVKHPPAFEGAVRELTVPRGVPTAVTPSLRPADQLGGTPMVDHDELPARFAGIDYREHLAEQLRGTVFSELNALATRLAAQASWTRDPAQRSGLLAEADTVATLLGRLRTILFTLDPFDPATLTCPASREGG
jgi:hypothetical protein